MKVMVLLKATAESEAGRFPSETEITATIEFNERLVEAGILLSADGLYPSARGARISFETVDGEDPSVVDGPFAETKELVSGFWIVDVASIEAAVELFRELPCARGASIELRQIISPEDFEQVDPELRERVERMEAEADSRAS